MTDKYEDVPDTLWLDCENQDCPPKGTIGISIKKHVNLMEYFELKKQNQQLVEALEDLDMLFDNTPRGYLDKEKYQTIRDYINNTPLRDESEE